MRLYLISILSLILICGSALLYDDSVNAMQSESSFFDMRRRAKTDWWDWGVDYAIANKLTPFISMQNHYSLAYREEEREMNPTLKVCSLLPSFLLHTIFAAQHPTSTITADSDTLTRYV